MAMVCGRTTSRAPLERCPFMVHRQDQAIAALEYREAMRRLPARGQQRREAMEYHYARLHSFKNYPIASLDGS